MLKITGTSKDAEDNKFRATQINCTKFQTKSTNVYVQVVTFSLNENLKCLENTKQGIKRTYSWSKYRSEVTTQPKNNILYYMVDPISIGCLYFKSK